MRQSSLIILSVVTLLTFSAAAADEIPKERAAKTKLEAFEAQTGTVLIKGIQEVGSVSGMGAVTVECREFIDGTTRRKEHGITIEVKESGRLERSATSLVDYDEIDALLKGIDYIAKVDKSATELANFEAVYRTKGDLRITTFSSDRDSKIQAAVSSGQFGASTAFLSLEQLLKVRALVETAKEKLDSIRSKN